MVLAKQDNKVMINDGKLLTIPDYLELILEVSGTSFPDRAISTDFIIGSSVSGNTMYADLNDGTGIRVIQPNQANNHRYGNSNTNLYLYFQDVPADKLNTIDPTYSVKRFIKLKFKYPSAVSQIKFQSVGVYGEIPKVLGLFNFSAELTISNNNAGLARWESFPADLKGISTSNLGLNSAFKTKPTYLPAFIGNSIITTLILVNCFDWSASNTVTGVDAISGVVGLTTLVIGTNNMGNNSFPSTLKNITTLRNLSIANPFTTFPSPVGECAQVETLTISRADGSGYANLMTNWGAGLGLMVNLKTLYYDNTTVLTTDLPAGLANCTLLKTVTFHGSFNTVAKIDGHVNNWYDFIVANASTTSGNTKFRNMSFQSNAAFSVASLRPSGGVTPTAVTTPPTTPIEKIYNLCKLYGHTWIVRNTANNGYETITPTS